MRYANGHLWSIGFDGADQGGKVPIDLMASTAKPFEEVGDFVLF